MYPIANLMEYRCLIVELEKIERRIVEPASLSGHRIVKSILEINKKKKEKEGLEKTS